MVKQRRLIDFLKKCRGEDLSGGELVELLYAKGLEHVYSASTNSGFDIYYIPEPWLNFGGDYTGIDFPREFSAIKRFYTSDSKISARVRLCFDQSIGSMVKKVVNHIESVIGKHGGRLNFDLVVELASSDDPVAHACKLMEALSLQRGSLSIDIVGLVNRGELGGTGFAKIKAFSVAYEVPSHIVNLQTVHRIVQECFRDAQLSADTLERAYKVCPGYRAYILNNVVQLYAKVEGIPWTAGGESEKLLKDKLIIGLAASRYGGEGGGYYLGVSFAVAYRGVEVQSYVAVEEFSKNDIDADVLRNRGLYIPRKVVEQLIGRVVRKLGRYRYVVLFQTPILHEGEVEALKNTLTNVHWLAVHLKTSGFAKRVYDRRFDDYGPQRGICAIDTWSFDSWQRGGPLRAILVTTGRIFLRKRTDGGREVIEPYKLYKGTPRPLELEVVLGPEYVQGLSNSSDVRKALVNLVSSVASTVLLLTKLDWEAYAWWPKIPFVVKYAKRIAQILSYLKSSSSADLQHLADEVYKKLTSDVKPLRYIM